MKVSWQQMGPCTHDMRRDDGTVLARVINMGRQFAAFVYNGKQGPNMKMVVSKPLPSLDEATQWCVAQFLPANDATAVA
jgi:hypothetical protein